MSPISTIMDSPPLSALPDLIGLDMPAQTNIERTSQAEVRALGMLNLPDEILARVFEYAAALSGGTGNAGCMRAVRLTCRRFCAVSTPLLFETVCVEMQSASLERLEAIASHPLFRLDVKRLRIHLAGFCERLANDFWSFARYMRSALDNDRWQHWGVQTEDFDPADYAEDAPVMRFVAALSDFDVDFHRDGPITGLSDEQLELFKSAHAQYQRRFHDQETLRSSGAFAEALTSALARMPNARSLRLDDWPSRNPRSPATIGSDLWGHAGGPFLAACVQPFPWCSETWSMGLPTNFDDYMLTWRDIPYRFPAALPLALHKASVSPLTTLEIILTTHDYMSFHPVSDNQSQRLAAVGQELRSFVFGDRNSDITRERLLLEEAMVGHTAPVKRLFKFVAAFLHGPHLQEIDLDFQAFWSYDSDKSGPPRSVGSVINVRTWPELRSFCLSRASLHISELEQFVEGLGDARGLFLLFQHVNLLDGSWEDALDIMRRSGPHIWHIIDPRGGDVDSMKIEDKWEMFGDELHNTSSAPSLAEKFARGEAPENPLRVLERDTLPLPTLA